MILKNLCIENNIHIIFREESYTSKASFLDCDEIQTYKEKYEYTFSGEEYKEVYIKQKMVLLSMQILMVHLIS